MKYVFEVEGLKLPTMNRFLRMFWRDRYNEGKEVKQRVINAARSAGYINPSPLRKAHVAIVAHGPYQRRDSDATVAKQVLDALVARKIRRYGQNIGREFGFLEDDSRAVIGDLEFKTVLAKDYKVEVQIYEV